MTASLKVVMSVTMLTYPLVGGAFGQVDEAVRLLDAGNQHYAHGAFRKALQAYEGALLAGFASGALYYNMGNAYYRLDSTGQALRHYEKARHLIGDDPQLMHGRTMALARIGTPFSAVPVPFWTVGWQNYIARWGVWVHFFVGYILYLTAAVLFAYKIWVRPRNPWHRRALLVTAVAGGFFIAAAFGISLNVASDPQAVVIARSAPLYTEPDDAAETELSVPEGVIVSVLEPSGGFVEVRLPNGIRGYVRQRLVGDI